MSNVAILCERLRALPWPALGGTVGDFSLYDTLLAGCANTVANGRPIDLSQIPFPDEACISFVAVLRNKNALTEEEKEFLKYFDLLEEIRSTLEHS